MPAMPRIALTVVICGALTALSTSFAAAQTIDEAFRSDIEKMMEITGARQMGAQMAAMVGNQFLAGMKQSNPEVPDGAIAIVKDVLNEEFGRMFDGPDGVLPSMVALYAKYFSHEEIQGLLAFYATDLGKKNVNAALITDPSSVAWIFNIRGADVPHTPHPLARAIIYANGEAFRQRRHDRILRISD